MNDLRKDCQMRHENGNCNVIGGFCTAVNDSICAGLHNAYDCGYYDGEIRAKREQGQSARWISVKDGLPGRYETVLIAISTVNGYGDPAKLVTIGGYDHSEKRWEQYTSTDRQLCRGETVTHWMPLPEPPGHRSGQDCYPNHTIEPAWKRQFMRTFLRGR